MKISHEKCKETMEKVLDYFFLVKGFDDTDYATLNEADEAYHKASLEVLYKKGYYEFTKDDKALLTKYAQIFDTLPRPVELFKVMFELVKLVGFYRSDKVFNTTMQKLNEQNSVHNIARRMNEKQKTREESLKTHIDAILDYIGHKDRMVNPKGKEEERNRLRHELKKAYDKPSNYIITGKTPTIKASKEPIRDYLNSLKLPGKTNVIKSFIKEIE